MQKHTTHQEKTIKQFKNMTNLTKSFITISESESNLLRNQKRMVSTQKEKTQIQKNDQRVPIYIDKLGFVVQVMISLHSQHSILNYGLKCQCFITENSLKKNTKGIKAETIQARRPSTSKKKVKLQISINKLNLAIVKGGVQHIFSLPTDSKHNHLKVFLSENWSIQQFTIMNKKTRISQSSKYNESNCDCIYPLKNIDEADELRKNKLIKSDSKVKIAWGHTIKDPQLSDTSQKNNQILSFDLTKKSSKVFSKSFAMQPNNQIQPIVFLRKSFNQCDQTQDSEGQLTVEEKRSLNGSRLSLSGINKTVSINLSLWNQQQTSRKQFNETTPRETKNQKLQHKGNWMLTDKFFKGL